MLLKGMSHLFYSLIVHLEIRMVPIFFNTCTVPVLLFCTMTNKCIINGQIITLLLMYVKRS